MPPQPVPRPPDNGAVTQPATDSETGDARDTRVTGDRSPEPGESRPKLPARGLLVAGLLTLAFVGLSAIVALGDAPAWEDGVVDTATRAPAAIGSPSRAVMELGTRTVLPAIALVAYLLTFRWQPAVAVIVAGVAASLVTGTSKQLVGRDRPSDVAMRDSADGFGFPSGHTTFAFAVAAVIAPHVASRWGWRVALIPFAIAAIVGFARMYVGVHFPMDVVGGALAGTAAGLAVVAIPVFRPKAATGHATRT